MEYGPWLFDLLGGRMAAATARIDFRRSLARLRGLWPVCGPHAADYARADCVVRRRSRKLSRGESKKSPRPGVGADECQHAPQQDRLGALGSPFARARRVSAWERASAARVLMLQGAMIIPAVRKEPLASEAPMSRSS